MHIGRNVSKLRELKGLKQEDFAKLLGISQQAISKLENKKEIDDTMLQKIAEKLDITPESIRSFNPDTVIHSINQQGGNVYAEIFNLNPIEKIVELYEKMLREKDETIKLLREEIKSFKKK